MEELQARLAVTAGQNPVDVSYELFFQLDINGSIKVLQEVAALSGLMHLLRDFLLDPNRATKTPQFYHLACHTVHDGKVRADRLLSMIGGCVLTDFCP